MTTRLSVNEIYPRRFFARRNKLSWRAPIVCGAIVNVLEPKSAIDVGCAIGDLVEGFVRLGVDAYGLDGSEGCKEFLECDPARLFIHDLRMPVVSKSRYSLVTCFEVAEHIEKEYAPRFVNTLCQLSDRILMSAAPPFQEGHHHVNCREPKYWQEMFGKRRYYRDTEIEERLKKQWEPWRKLPGIKAYYQNLLYFAKGESR